jgi:hypothetical protein
MTHRPMNKEEQHIVSDSLASIAWLISGHVPDRISETLDYLINTLDLPQPRRWQKFAHVWNPPRCLPRVSERMTDDELNIILAWLDSVASIYNDKVNCQAMKLSTRLRHDLELLVTEPFKTRTWWRELDADVKQCHLLGLMP